MILDRSQHLVRYPHSVSQCCAQLVCPSFYKCICYIIYIYIVTNLSQALSVSGCQRSHSPQKNLSFSRFLFPISWQAVNGWFDFADRCWITPHQCQTCLWHRWRRRVGGGGRSQHNREKNKQVSKVIERFLRVKPKCLLWDWQSKEAGGWAKSLMEHSNHGKIANLRSSTQTLYIMYLRSHTCHTSAANIPNQVKSQKNTSGKSQTGARLRWK